MVPTYFAILGHLAWSLVQCIGSYCRGQGCHHLVVGGSVNDNLRCCKGKPIERLEVLGSLNDSLNQRVVNI
ncbi:unnamed protein product [Camellia sinensis]